MTININFTAAEYFMLAVQLVSIGLGVSFARAAKARYQGLKKVAEGLTEREQHLNDIVTPDQFATNIAHLIKARFLVDLEALEHVESDLRYHHDELYKRIDHPGDCPFCGRTAAHLHEMIEAIRGAPDKLKHGWGPLGE